MASNSDGPALYASVGPQLTHYDVDVEASTLTRRGTVGLPAGKSGQDSGRSRNGAWAPVAITLKGSNQGNPRDAYRLRIETNDSEDLTYQYTVPVPALGTAFVRRGACFSSSASTSASCPALCPALSFSSTRLSQASSGFE